MTDTAKVKNVSGEPLSAGWLGGRLVLDGEAVEVPAEDVYAYTQQTDTWAPYDNPAKKAHKDGTEAREGADADAAALFEARFGSPPAEPEAPNLAAAQSPDAATPSAEPTGPLPPPIPTEVSDETPVAPASPTTSTSDSKES